MFVKHTTNGRNRTKQQGDWVRSSTGTVACIHVANTGLIHTLEQLTHYVCEQQMIKLRRRRKTIRYDHPPNYITYPSKAHDLRAHLLKKLTPCVWKQQQMTQKKYKQGQPFCMIVNARFSLYSRFIQSILEILHSIIINSKFY